MRALCKAEADGGLALVERPRPTPGPGELLVRVSLAGICGTDLSIRDWRPYVRAHVRLPRVLGHEFVGVVDEAGPVTSLPVGSRVTADTDGGCGHCVWCRRGDRHACARQERIGTQRDGALAELVVVPERSAYLVPDEVDDVVACLLEPMAAAVHAVERLPAPLGATAAVIGPGPIGVLAAITLQEAGAGPVHVLGLSGDQDRLALARTFGLEASTTQAGVGVLRGRPPLGGVDLVVDAVGSADSIAVAMDIARFGGAISVVGLGGSGPLDPGPLVAKELAVTGSWRRLPTTWDRTLAIAARRADLARLVEGRYGLADHEAAFAGLAEGRHMKTVIDPGGSA